MTHDRLAVEKCSGSWMSGSAMFTIVASRTTISWQVRIVASTSRGRCGRGGQVLATPVDLPRRLPTDGRPDDLVPTAAGAERSELVVTE